MAAGRVVAFGTVREGGGDGEETRGRAERNRVGTDSGIGRNGRGDGKGMEDGVAAGRDGRRRK